MLENGKSLSQNSKISSVLEKYNQSHIRIHPGWVQAATSKVYVCIDIKGTIVSKSNFIKYIGAILDIFLSMKQHIMQKCKTAMWNLYRIKHVRHCLTREACHTLVLGLVIPHLDYTNIIFLKHPDSTKAKLQWVQNIAARCVLNKEQVESTMECLKIFHWLPIKARVEYKAIILVHKSLQGRALGYLQNMFAVNPVPNRCLRLSSRPNKLIVPFTRCKTFADRSLSVEGPRLWNSLPHEMRSLQDTDQFKARLKTLLFKKFIMALV